MIINKEKSIVKVEAGKTVKTEMTVGDMDFIIGTLIDSYGNPFIASIREVIINAIDANNESGSSEPVLVSLIDTDGVISVNVKDTGIGISPERFHKIFMVVGNSTKRKSNNQTGGFGIGSLAPLSYSKQFSILTVNGGIEYKYTLIRDGDKVTSLKIYEKPTDKNSGTLITYYVNKEHSRDDIIRAFIKSTAAINNIILFTNWEDNEYSINTINNRKAIINKNYIIPKSYPSHNIYIKVHMGGIIYETSIPQSFDFNHKKDMVLNFNIGDLVISRDRERVIDNISNNTLIINKMKKVNQELLKKLEKQEKGYLKNPPVDQIFKDLINGTLENRIEIGTNTISIEFKNLKLFNKDLNIDRLKVVGKEFMRYWINLKIYHLKNDRLEKRSINLHSFMDYLDNKKIVKMVSTNSTNLKKYYKELILDDTIGIIDYNFFYSIKTIIRRYTNCNELKVVLEYLKKKYSNLKLIDKPSDEFLKRLKENRKKTIRIKRDKNIIKYKLVRERLNYDSEHQPVLERCSTVNVTDIFTNKVTVFVDNGYKDISSFFNAFKNHLKIIIINKKDTQLFMNTHKKHPDRIMPISKVNKDFRILRKVITAQYILEQVGKIPINYGNTIRNQEEIASLRETLNKYKLPSYGVAQDFKKQLIKYGVENNILDYSLMNDYKKLSPDIKALKRCKKMNISNSDIEAFILFKLGYRISFEAFTSMKQNEFFKPL